MPTPNFLNACRRVTDWAKPLASSSNLLFTSFPFALPIVGFHTLHSSSSDIVARKRSELTQKEQPLLPKKPPHAMETLSVVP
jgi:hypothetical protein